MTQPITAMPPVATPEQWKQARLALLSHEKELTKQKDQVNAERRRLPMVQVTKNYAFAGNDGDVSLLDLFEDKKQLIVYHFMFDPSWDTGCTGCTGLVNAIGDVSMLAKRDTRFVLVSRAPLQKLNNYKASKGWTLPWYSSFGTDFNCDFGVTIDPAKNPSEYNYKPLSEFGHDMAGEQPGFSVYLRDGKSVYHTYSTFARGSESITDAYALLDITPYGRQEDFEDSPSGWPQHPTYG